jgi:glycosyltransferase involved in cell wall biosynthesis
MSWCESFGIPAVEAQAFSTPVVSSNCCAIPEICGDGGIYPDPGDLHSVADSLAELLNNKVKWDQLSEAARDNASKFRWDICSRPLLDVFNNLQNQKQN